MTSHFFSATSASTVVSNVATSPEYTSYPKQDDDVLWNLYADAIPLPPNHIIPEAEKQMHLQMILSIPLGGWVGAIKYLQHVKQILHNPNTPWIGMHCLSTISHLILTTIGHCSFNAPEKAFYARLLNLITSKYFTILHILTVDCPAGTFISLAQVLPQVSALIGLQRASISYHMVWAANGVNAWG